MQRELKFRIWHKKKAAWISDEVMLYDTLSRDGWEWDWINEQRPRLNNDDIIVQQYTGLRDKNGTEIYEGDTLSCPFQFNPDAKFIGFVVYFESGFLLAKVKSSDSDPLEFWDFNTTETRPFFWNRAEIINNIPGS